MNKKGQFESILLVIVSLIVIGIMVFFMNHLNSAIYQEFDSFINDSKYDETEVDALTTQLVEFENSGIWDYVFLAVVLGFVIQIIIFSFATRINIAFFWLMLIIDLPIFVVGVVLSNMWQQFVEDPTFAVTITNFPITNAILGNYFPIFIIFLIFLSSIILFGKRPGEL